MGHFNLFRCGNTDADCEGGFSGETVCLRDGGDAPFLYLFDSTSADQYDTAKEFTLTGIVGELDCVLPSHSPRLGIKKYGAG